MKELLTYNELSMINDDKTINESISSLQELAGKSISSLKRALKTKLEKEAPSLAANNDFIEQLADSFSFES